MFEKTKQQWQKLQFTRKYQRAFLEDLASLIEDGVSVTQAVETIRQITSGVTKMVATEVMNHISQGNLLADGMKGWFPYPVVEAIRASESGGTLKLALRNTATSFSERSNAINILIKSLLYPLIVFILALVVVVFIKNYVLITFAQIKPISQWPDIGKNLYALGYVTEHWWWFFLLFFSLIILFIVKTLQYLTGEVRRWIDKIPLLSLYREMMAAQLMETLGLLISNGILIKQAFKVMQQQASPYLSWHIMQMEYQLSEGQDNIADVLDTELINKNDLIRLKVVAKGKGFEQALLTLGRQATIRNAQTIAVTGKIAGGIFLAFGACIAIMVVLGIYSIGSMLAF